jgi:glycosyltransferase involved in cell wall biosynthesis
LPPVSRSVQAVPSIVLDERTGILEGPEAPASRYVGRILAEIQERTRYRQMARAARSRFESALSWEQFADRTVSIIENHL